MTEDALGKPLDGWRLKVYTVIFEADTVAGRRFDAMLILAILVSFGVVMADSVQSLSRYYSPFFSSHEWFFTVFFTLEYIARLVCVRRPLRYATSFFGVIDVLAVLPPEFDTKSSFTDFLTPRPQSNQALSTAIMIFL